MRGNGTLRERAEDEATCNKGGESAPQNQCLLGRDSRCLNTLQKTLKNFSALNLEESSDHEDGNC